MIYPPLAIAYVLPKDDGGFLAALRFLRFSKFDDIFYTLNITPYTFNRGPEVLAFDLLTFGHCIRVAE